MNQYINTNFTIDADKIVTISYTNWKGITANRKIVPQKIFFSSNEFHLEKQWLIEAHDVDKKVMRTFACKNIYSWK